MLHVDHPVTIISVQCIIVCLYALLPSWHRKWWLFHYLSTPESVPYPYIFPSVYNSGWSVVCFENLYSSLLAYSQPSLLAYSQQQLTPLTATIIMSNSTNMQWCTCTSTNQQPTGNSVIHHQPYLFILTSTHQTVGLNNMWLVVDSHLNPHVTFLCSYS